MDPITCNNGPSTQENQLILNLLDFGHHELSSKRRLIFRPPNPNAIVPFRHIWNMFVLNTGFEIIYQGYFSNRIDQFKGRKFYFLVFLDANLLCYEFQLNMRAFEITKITLLNRIEVHPLEIGMRMWTPDTNHNGLLFHSYLQLPLTISIYLYGQRFIYYSISIFIVRYGVEARIYYLYTVKPSTYSIFIRAEKGSCTGNW